MGPGEDNILNDTDPVMEREACLSKDRLLKYWIGRGYKIEEDILTKRRMTS